MHKLTYLACLVAYEALIEARGENQALVLGDNRYAVLTPEGVRYVQLDEEGFARGPFLFDERNWDAERSCWGDQDTVSTRQAVDEPQFITPKYRPARKRGEKTWGEQRYAQILYDARERYGKGWDQMSQDARENYISSRILSLLLSQAEPKYEPAHDLVRQVYRAKSDAESN